MKIKGRWEKEIKDRRYVKNTKKREEEKGKNAKEIRERKFNEIRLEGKEEGEREKEKELYT